jgi:hypothetical protein
VAAPWHPQTLGKIERFWGSLWRECVETAVFADLGDARRRIGLFIDSYNFRRPHQGLDAAVPADRCFGADSAVRQALEAWVAANALELARNGLPRPPFYLAGQAGGEPVASCVPPGARGTRLSGVEVEANSAHVFAPLSGQLYRSATRSRSRREAMVLT